MSKISKRPVTTVVDPLMATSALGLAQLCMLRYFEEMNIQPKEKRAISSHAQKKLLHVISSIYHDCMDAVGIRNLVEHDVLPAGIDATLTSFGDYMGIDSDYADIDRAV